MLPVIALTLPFFALVFLGFLAGRILKKPAEGLEWLNIFILYIALPALFFQLLAGTPFGELSNVGFIIAVLAGTFGLFAVAFVIGLVRSRFRVAPATIKALMSAYSNNGYLGPGLAITALGAPAAVPVALIFAFENTVFFMLTPILMAIGGSVGQSAPGIALTILKRIFTHPFILAVIAGTLASVLSWQPPDAIDRLLTMLRSAAAPCALFAMGVTVALQPLPPKGAIGDLSIFLTFKLIVHPLVAYVAVSAAEPDPLWLTTAVLMAALPPATNVFVLATQYRTAAREASNAILVGTAASALTVTAVLFALTR